MRLWPIIGRISYYLSWPGIAFYLKGSSRTRVIVDYKGKILVVRGWLSDGKWSLPGGGLHNNETVEAGAIRELAEETSVALSQLDLKVLKAESFRRNGVSMQLYYCYCKLSTSVTVKQQNGEITDIAWVEPEKLNHKNAGKDVLRAIAIWKAS